MTKQELMQKLTTDKITMDDFLNLLFTMSKMDVGRVLTELYYTLYVECGCDEHKANRCLLGYLLEAWDDELTD